MSAQIDVIAKVTQQVDEILYLQKSRTELKDLANQYVTIIKSNYESIRFFPSISNELKSSLEKKNFNISNAKENIDRLNASLKKLEYIKSSIVSYDSITDSVIRTKTNLDAFKTNIHFEAQNATLSSVENLYSQVVNKYNEIQSQSGDVNDIRNKYSQLSQLVNSHKSILGDFIKVYNELSTFIGTMSLNKIKVDFYLKTFSDSMSKLNQIKSHSLILNSISQDELRCISPKIISDLQQIKSATTYDLVTQHANNSQKLNETVTYSVNLLRNLRNSFVQLKSKINSSQNSFFNSDYKQILAEVSKIEPILHSNLDSNFGNCTQLINSLDVKVNSSLNNFSSISSKAQQLFQRVESSKTEYWLEDYNEIISKIKGYQENQSSIKINEIHDLIESKNLIKRSQIDNFIKSNQYLLSESGLLSHINSGFKTRLISKNEFETFTESTLRRKDLKIILYKIKAFFFSLGKFLIKPTTLKYGAIILGIGLAIIFIISYWLEILIICGIIFLIMGLFNSKK
jgi:hypothetical protein